MRLEGGLGSMISEIAAEIGGARICRIGVRYPFLNRCGSYDYLLEQHGLSAQSIAAKVSKFITGDPGCRAIAA